MCTLLHGPAPAPASAHLPVVLWRRQAVLLHALRDVDQVPAQREGVALGADGHQGGAVRGALALRREEIGVET